MWPWWFIILSLYVAGSSTQGIQSATNVIFQSINFKNILTWCQEVNDSQEAVYYVEYKIYGDKLWKNKTECQHIAACECDLTYETAEESNWFYARVTSNRTHPRWSKSERFCPMENTTIGAPDVKYKLGARSISILVEPPHFPCSTNISCSNKFESIEYLVALQHQSSNEKQLGNFCAQHTSQSKRLDIKTLEPGTHYCGTVQLLLDHGIHRKRSVAFQFCFNTLKDVPYNIVAIFLFLGTLIIFTICCLAYRYVTLGKRLPASLNLQSLLNRSPSTPTLSLVGIHESRGRGYEFQQIISMEKVCHSADKEQNWQSRSLASVTLGDARMPQSRSSSRHADFTVSRCQRTNVSHSPSEGVDGINASPYCPQLAESSSTTAYASQNAPVALTQTYGTVLTGSPGNSNGLGADTQQINEESPSQGPMEVYFSNNEDSLKDSGLALDFKYVGNGGERVASILSTKDETPSQWQALVPLIEGEMPAFEYAPQRSQLMGPPTSPSGSVNNVEDMLERWGIQVLLED